MKNLLSNKDQIKGFSSKYITKLTDLLSKKNKNYTKKRLELYNQRIKELKRNVNDDEKKNNLKTYSSLTNINSKLNRMFNSKKSETVTMFFNKSYKKRQSQSYIYSKTTNNFPTQSNSVKSLFQKPKRKKLCLINRNKVNGSNTLSLFGFNENDYNSYDNLNKEQEEFLMYHDNEKYHKYLKKKYQFFNLNDINQIIFLNERNKRFKLFKSIENNKFFEKQKKVTFKEQLINKIFREKDNNDFILPKFLISKQLKIKGLPIKTNDNKQKFYDDCKKIYLNIKKNLL